MHSILAGTGMAVFSIGLIFMLHDLITRGIQKILRYFKDLKHNKVSDKSDIFNQWVTKIDDKIKKNNLRIKIVQYLTLTTVLVVTMFFLSMYIFKNLTASIFLAASFFIIPEYLISIMHDKRKIKIEDQLVAAIRIFSAEFIQTPQIEKGLAAVAVRIGNPVGGYFNDAYHDLMLGRSSDMALATLSAKLDTEYGKMFIQLIQQARKDTSVRALFTDLLSKIEKHLELTRQNISSLTGERILAFIMTMIPVPAYLFINRIIPESKTFIVETFIGRTLITLAFGSMFLWTIIDKITRRVEV